MRPVNTMLRTGLAVVFALLMAGCSTTPNASAVPLNPTTGAHPSDWLVVHWSAYVQNPASCTPCHDSASVQPATAPQSGVTCFGCHHPDGPDHPSTWNLPVPIPDHGNAAISAAAAPFDPSAPVFAMSGFASCTPCHGPLYNNASNGYAPSCYSCHTTAPHPPKPWGAGLGLPLGQPRHDLVDTSNAPECFKCHANGANSDITPVPPAAPGTVPGCFNGTLCHTTNPTQG